MTNFCRPWFIFAFLILIFFPTLFLGQSLYFRDIYAQDLPAISYFLQALKSGDYPPLWNPLIFSGFPQMASLQPPVFYPGLALYLFLPFHVALSATLIAHYFLAAFGVYSIARYWKVEPGAATVGAIIFSLNGYILELTNTQYIVFAIAWVPYIFLYANKLYDRTSLKNTLLLILVCCLQIATGRVDYFYFTALMLAPWLLGRLAKDWGDGRTVVNYGGAGLIALSALAATCILSLQILPSLAFIKTTIRSVGMDLELATTWALHPAHLLQLGFSNLYGDLGQSAAISYLIAHGVLNYSFFVYNLYIGLPALILVWLSWRRSSKTRALAGIAIFFGLLSLGDKTLLYETLYTHLPGFDSSRYPSKLFAFTLFCLSLIIAIGLQEAQLKSSQRRIIKTTIVATASLCILTLAVLVFQNPIIEYFNGHLAPYSAHIQDIDFFIKSLICAAVPLLLFTLLFNSYKSEKLSYATFAGALALLLAADLSWQGARNTPTIDAQNLYRESELARDIKQDIGDPNLYRVLFHYEGNNPVLGNSQRESDFLNAINTADCNLTLNSRLYNVFGYYPEEPILITNAVGSIKEQMPGISISSRTKARVMRWLGVKYYVWHTGNKIAAPPDPSYFSLKKRYDPYQVELWELKDPAERFSFHTISAVYKDEITCLKALLMAERYKLPEGTLILLGNEDYKAAVTATKPDKNHAGEALSIQLTHEKGSRLELEVFAPESGYLALGNRFSEGWTAHDNGVEIPVLQANHFQQALRISSGKHVIRLEYMPQPYELGKKISLATLLVILIASLLVVKFKNRPGAGSPAHEPAS